MMIRCRVASSRILCSLAANNSWSSYSSRGLAEIPTFQKRADPTNDTGFKNLFKRDTSVLKEFLSDVLGEGPIESVRITENEILRRNPQAKGGFMDVECYLESGKIIVVEMHVDNTDNFTEPAVFYASHVYSTQLKGGSKFSYLNPVVLVTISAYKIFPVAEISEFYSKHIIANSATGKETIKELKWIFIELPKLKKRKKDIALLENDLEVWTYFFKYASILKEEDLSELVKRKKVLRTASQSLDMASWEEDDRIAYTRSLIYESDKASLIERSVKEAAKRIAKKLLAEGVRKDIIRESTGLEEKDYVE